MSKKFLNPKYIKIEIKTQKIGVWTMPLCLNKNFNGLLNRGTFRPINEVGSSISGTKLPINEDAVIVATVTGVKVGSTALEITKPAQIPPKR